MNSRVALAEDVGGRATLPFDTGIVHAFFYQSGLIAMASFKDAEELGRGGFGVVCKCIRESDGVVFAKKTLLLDDPGSIKRFQREVRLIQKLRHPGIIKIISTHLEEPPYWYVMKHYAIS